MNKLLDITLEDFEWVLFEIYIIWFLQIIFYANVELFMLMLLDQRELPKKKNQ